MILVVISSNIFYKENTKTRCKYLFRLGFPFKKQLLLLICRTRILLFPCLYHFRNITCFVYSYFFRFFIAAVFPPTIQFPLLLFFFLLLFKSSFQGQYTTGTTSIYATHIHIQKLVRASYQCEMGSI